MTKLDGEIRWRGPDPDVIHYTDNGKRKVQMRLLSGGFQVLCVISDVDALIRDLQEVQGWARTDDGA